MQDQQSDNSKNFNKMESLELKNKETITLKPSQWKATDNIRSKGRMEIRIKLDKDSAEGLKNFIDVYKPESIDTREFYKIIMYYGMAAINEETRKRVVEKLETESPPGELEVSIEDNIPVIHSDGDTKGNVEIKKL